MSERLKRFRQLMSAFEGTSNPQRAIEQGYYVDLPNNPVKEITRRVELRPSSIHLLMGGVGSGKTTQLLLTKEHIDQLEDSKAIYIDVSFYTDISRLELGSLIVISAIEFEKFLDDSDDENNIKIAKQKIQKIAYGEFVDPYYDDDGGWHFRPGILKNEKSNLPFSQLGVELTEGLEILYDALRNKLKKDIVLIFDGLDRLHNPEIFFDTALKDILALSSYGLGILIVAPISIAYTNKVENSFNYLYYFPYFDVSQNQEIHQFFMDILIIRDPDNFITSTAKQFLIVQSGGVLRDLMSLTQSAIEEAYVDGSDDVQVKHAEEAVNSLARSKFMGLTGDNIITLNQVISQRTFLPRTPEELDLLLTGHILEYRYPRRHFAVHPVLLPLLQENMSMSVAHE